MEDAEAHLNLSESERRGTMETPTALAAEAVSFDAAAAAAADDDDDGGGGGRASGGGDNLFSFLLSSADGQSSSAQGTFRRTRAETFSSLPSRMRHDDHSLPPLNAPGFGSPILSSSTSTGASNPRVRSGSLSLPAQDLASSSPFGMSLFASSPWQQHSTLDFHHHHKPSSNLSTTAPITGVEQSDSKAVGNSGRSSVGDIKSLTASAQAAFESLSINGDDSRSVARTLDYLGLDDQDGASGVFGSSLSVPQSPSGMLRGSSSNQYLRPTQQLASPQPTTGALDSSGGLPSFVTQTSAGHRARSYTVAVGESLDFKDGNSSGGNGALSSYRPRASSIAFLESSMPSLLEQNVVMDQFTASAERRLRESLAASGRHDIPDRSDGAHSPQDCYFDRSLDDSPTYSSGHEGNPPSRSLWIGNIDTSVMPADLLSIFNSFGAIESMRMVPEKECAFINFIRVEDAIAARDKIQGMKISGLPIRLGFGRTDPMGDSGMQPTKSLWIGNIPPTTDPVQLESIFSSFGPVESARVLTHKNCGFVNFDQLEDAIEARKSMNGRDIGGSVVKIGFAKVPSRAELAMNSPGGGYLLQGAGFGSPGSVVADIANLTPSVASGVPLAVRERSASGSIFNSPSRTQSNPNIAGTPLSVNGLDSESLSSGGEYNVRGSFSSSVHVDDIQNVQHFDRSDGNLVAPMLEPERYYTSLPPLPEPNPHRQVDQNRLREMRKRLESHISPKEVESMFLEVLPECVDLCTDYIGNVVIQKILERSGDSHRLLLLEAVAAHMAVIGVHKNGTWVIQKMIDLAKTPAQMACVVNALRPFTPPLLLDQFGNYVVQCCLRMGPQRNQFVFDSMHSKCPEIGLGRFGARAMRACLESQYTTKRQQKHVAIAIVGAALQLVINPNGAILITWLLDTSSLPGRYRVLAPKLAPHVHSLCNHKLASATILKLVNQRVELDARDVIIKELFFGDESALRDVLLDHIQGVSVIQKILASACVSPDERVRLADRCRSVLARVAQSGGVSLPHIVKDNQMGFRRLLDELAVIPSSLSPNGAPLPLLMLDSLSGAAAGSSASYMKHDIVSPLTPHTPGGFFPQATGNNGGVGGGGPAGSGGYPPYPTPGHSPQSMYHTNPAVSTYGMMNHYPSSGSWMQSQLPSSQQYSAYHNGGGGGGGTWSQHDHNQYQHHHHNRFGYQQYPQQQHQQQQREARYSSSVYNNHGYNDNF